MCGIAGALFASTADPLAPVRAMCERMRARGPDAADDWIDRDAGVCLGHRRLSIIDLDARANQPFASADGRWRIVFNGEIYNYRELGAELEQAGVRLRTTSDTEVVLELYRREGTAAFARLRGMFALAIWDADRGRLVLARDPYGIKPLYLAHTPDGVLFASQVKGLMASGRMSRTLDNAGVAGFWIWGSTPEPFTIYQDVRAVPAGSVVTLARDGGAETASYADIAQAWTAPPTEGELAEQVRAALQSTVRAHLVADVPVAVLLSGGVDSGVAAGLMAEQGQAVEGVTIAFPEFAGGPRDEVPRAQAIARAYGVAHTVRPVERAEFLADLPLILDAMDQPSIDGVNTWFGAKAIAERGFKVALSGVGGDELFCGYDSFHAVPSLHRIGRLAASVRPLAGPVFAAAGRLLGKPKLAGIPAFAGSLEGAYMLRRALFTPAEAGGVLRRDALADGLERLQQAQAGSVPPRLGPVKAVAVLESTRYLRNQLLRDSDWASMAHSLELRTPLVDWNLLRALAPHADRFVAGAGKRLQGDSPRIPLPAEVMQHRKTGFGLPIADWLGEAGGSAPPVAARGSWARRWAWVVADAFGFAA